MPRFPTAGSRSADSSARRRGGIFGRCSHASEGWRTCTSRDPRTWTRWLQAEPVVELHQQDVGGPVEEQLPLEVPVQVKRGIIRPVTRAALCPNDEEREPGRYSQRSTALTLTERVRKSGSWNVNRFAADADDPSGSTT